MIFLVSMVPIVELRGAIPISQGFQLPLLQSYIICVIGNMLPVPGTGAWTGTLAASFLDMGFKKSVLAVLGGVLLAGIVMGAASAGLFSALFAVF